MGRDQSISGRIVSRETVSRLGRNNGAGLGVGQRYNRASREVSKELSRMYIISRYKALARRAIRTDNEKRCLNPFPEFSWVSLLPSLDGRAQDRSLISVNWRTVGDRCIGRDAGPNPPERS